MVSVILLQERKVTKGGEIRLIQGRGGLIARHDEFIL